MLKEIAKEAVETKSKEQKGFKEIKPKGDISTADAKSFWDKTFDSFRDDIENIKDVLKDYIDDIKNNSEVADTIADNPIDVSDLKKCPPEKTAEMRKEFDDIKSDLKKQWEEVNNRPWPKYTEDVYITNSRGGLVKIREAGMDFDAHHIQPLSLGGKNEVSNLTPLKADIHFDSRGVHKEGSPFDQLSKMLGGAN